ncbi:MAG: SET domain-containing protein [Pseudomonadota bacterium]
MNPSDNYGMCVPCTIHTTPEKGRGLYATEFIAKGATVWRHISDQYAVFDEQTFTRLLGHLSSEDVEYVMVHIHCMPEFPEFLVWVFDGGELLNHSDEANISTYSDPEFHSAPTAKTVAEVREIINRDYFTLIATRDIKAGEELCMDYNDEPEYPQYYEDACDALGITWDWF